MKTPDCLRTARQRPWIGAVWALLAAALPPTHAAPLPQQMLAARADSAPGSLKIETVPVPMPAAGQVLIEVRAAGLNPSDWNIRPPPGSGGAAPPPPPGVDLRALAQRQPGNDVAGIVVALGSGVSAYRLGDAVIAALQESGGGAFAQYALAQAANMAKKPRNMSFEQAAGIPTAGLTGLRMVILADVKPGEHALVIGAAGGVGSTAVQALKRRGAYVIASASSRHNDYLHSIGADRIVNYDQPANDAPLKDVDVVLSTVGSENAAAVRDARRGGRVLLIAGRPDSAACEAAGVSCVFGGPGQGPSVGELLQQLSRMADAGQYRVNVEKTFPLQQANEAYSYGRSGNREGKIVMIVNAKVAGH